MESVAVASTQFVTGRELVSISVSQTDNRTVYFLRVRNQQKRLVLVESDPMMAEGLLKLVNSTFPDIHTQHIPTESEFRSRFEELASYPAAIFVLAVFLPWTRPSRNPTLPPPECRDFKRAGFRCLRHLASDRRTQDMTAIFHSLLDRFDIATELTEFPSVNHITARSGHRELIETLRSLWRPPDPAFPYLDAVRTLCKKLAEHIAKNPESLDEIEWRDLERTLAEVFEGLGFGVTLTRPAKDGGKDIILERRDGELPPVIYVEVKHWSSSKKVGGGPLKDFVQVVLRDQVDGLFLSSSGYTSGAYGTLTVIERKRLSIGDRKAIYRLCRTYTLVQSGLWNPSGHHLTEVLYNR